MRDDDDDDDDDYDDAADAGGGGGDELRSAWSTSAPVPRWQKLQVNHPDACNLT